MLMNASLPVDVADLPDEDVSAEDRLADDRVVTPFGSDHLREAARAITDLRRGATVIVVEGGEALACVAAETADGAGLGDLRRWTRGSLLCLRTVWRGSDPAHATITADPVEPAALGLSDVRRLADPMASHPPAGDGTLVAPDAAPAAIALAKLGHLLPVLLAGPMRRDAVDAARRAGALVVQAADIAALGAAGTLIRVGEARVPSSEAAAARLVAFRNPDTGAEHIAVVIGTPEIPVAGRLAPLVRVHSECFTGDVLGSLRCDCGPQLHAAMRRMSEEGCGIVLYLAQEGRGIGLLNKLRSYALQDQGLDTLDANRALGWDADERNFAPAAAMLRELGVGQVRLLTNNPDKVAALTAHGIAVERASLLVAANGLNDTYLATKATRFGHLLG